MSLEDGLQVYSNAVKDSSASDFELPVTLECSESKGFNECDNLFFSVVISGSVYGEFIMGVNEQKVAYALGLSSGVDDPLTSTAREQVIDIFSEIGNIAAGIALPKVKTKNRILSLTAPKVYRGSLRFAAVKMYEIRLELAPGCDVTCYFYLDEMELDVAKKYKEALQKLYTSNIDLKKSNEQLIQQKKKIVQAEKRASMGVLSAGVAHNINTPLGAIVLNCNSLENSLSEDTFDPEEGKKYVNNILITADRIANIISRLRSFIKAGVS